MAEPGNILMTDEVIVFDVRHHVCALWKPFLALAVYVAFWVAAMTVFAFFRSGVMVLAGTAGLVAVSLWSGWSVLAFTRAGLMLTDRRLIYRSGVLSRHLREVPLSKISDVSVLQSVSGRIFGVGDLVVTTPGDPGQRIPFLNMPGPERLKVKMLEQMHAVARSAASPGDVAREIAHEINRAQPTSEIGAIPPERPPLYSEIVDQIERMDAMRVRGVLTDEEFQKAKEALLERLDRERGG